MPDWPTGALSDLVQPGSPITYGVVKPGEEPEDGVLFIRSGDIANGRIDSAVLRRIRRDVSEQYRRTLLEGGELIVSLVGNPGQVAVVPSDLAGANIARQVGLVRLQPQVDTQFVKYYLLSPAGQAALGAQSLGSVQQVINLRDLKTLEVPTPPLEEQRAIAGVLGALDDKIEQNRRTARALERLARAIFRAWFVDFEPVKAKAEGATAFPSMPQPVFDALPTRFVDSPLGPVPDGWGQPELVADLEQRQVLLIGDGYRAKRSELSDQGLPFIRAKNVNETVITEGAELLGAEALSRACIKRSEVWDTVFTSKGTVGRLGLVTPGTGDVVYAPQVCFWRAVDRETLSPYFLYLWMRSEMFTKQWMAVKGETDMADFVSLSDQRAMGLLLPPLHVQRAFGQVVQPLIEFRAHLESESRKLAETRDLLLPKLLSGQVRVEIDNG